jgi:hypothetical protein
MLLALQTHQLNILRTRLFLIITYIYYSSLLNDRGHVTSKQRVMCQMQRKKLGKALRLCIITYIVAQMQRANPSLRWT